MSLAKLKLGGVLDRHDSLVGRDVARQHVQQRGLAAARAAADNDVGPRHDARLEEAEGRIAAAAEADQVRHLERPALKAADVEHRAIDRHGRYGDVHAGAVAQAGVAEGRCCVDVAAHRFDDVVDHRHQLFCAGEADRGQQDLAVDLDVDVARADHHDLGHLRAVQQRGERPKHGVVGRKDRLRLCCAHWINLTADGNARKVGSAVIDTAPLPVMVAVQAITPPAIVAWYELLPLIWTFAAGK